LKTGDIRSVLTSGDFAGNRPQVRNEGVPCT